MGRFRGSKRKTPKTVRFQGFIVVPKTGIEPVTLRFSVGKKEKEFGRAWTIVLIFQYDNAVPWMRLSAVRAF